MRWRELRGKLAAQPGHDEAVAQELPYRPLALAIARLRGDLDMSNQALLRLRPLDTELSFAASTTDVLVDLGGSAIEADVTLVSSVVPPRDALPVERRPMRRADEPAHAAVLALASHFVCQPRCQLRR